MFSYGERPYSNVENNKLSTYLDQGGRLSRPEGCNEQIYGLLLKCWNRDPDQRPDATFCSNFFKFLLPNPLNIRDIGRLTSNDEGEYDNPPNENGNYIN